MRPAPHDRGRDAWGTMVGAEVDGRGAPGNPSIVDYDGSGHQMTGEEVIRDVVNTMVNDIREDARAVIKAVTVEVLRCAMPTQRSPLCQVVSLCRFIADL